jgi:hypothetical protein
MSKETKTEALMSLGTFNITCPVVDLASTNTGNNKFLSYMYIASDKDTIHPAHCMVLKDTDNGECVLSKPFTLLHLATRRMNRELVGKKFANRIYEGQPGFNATPTGNIQEGYSHLCVVLYDDKVQVLTIEACKTQKDFWVNALKLSDVKKAVGVEIKQVNVANCLTVSKTTGNGYISSNKFKGYAPINLSKEQMIKIGECLKKNEEKIKNFLK